MTLRHSNVTNRAFVDVYKPAACSVSNIMVKEDERIVVLGTALALHDVKGIASNFESGHENSSNPPPGAFDIPKM
jgi:hypothetical protein